MSPLFFASAPPLSLADAVRWLDEHQVHVSVVDEHGLARIEMRKGSTVRSIVCDFDDINDTLPPMTEEIRRYLESHEAITLRVPAAKEALYASHCMVTLVPVRKGSSLVPGSTPLPSSEPWRG